MQVLLVVDDDAYVRLGSIIRHLCVGMIDEAAQLRILLRTRRKDVPEAVGPAPVLAVRHRMWLLDRHWPERVLEGLSGRPPDVIHCLSSRLGQWVRHVALSWNCRLIAHVTDLNDLRQFEKLLPDPELVGIAPTSHLHEVMVRRWPELSERIRLIPFGIPARAEPACLDDPHRVPSAIVSTPLTADCGLDLVLRAMRELIRGGQVMQLFVLSTGRAERGFRRQVDHLGLRPYVTFAGLTGDWDTAALVMSGADFYIEPNPNRRFSAHALTAMVNGLAVLAPHGTLEDYLIDGQTARLFDPVQPMDLAHEWGQLLLDRSLARRLAQSALDYARTHHQATRMVAATAALYRQVCAG